MQKEVLPGSSKSRAAQQGGMSQELNVLTNPGGVPSQVNRTGRAKALVTDSTGSPLTGMLVSQVQGWSEMSKTQDQRQGYNLCLRSTHSTWPQPRLETNTCGIGWRSSQPGEGQGQDACKTAQGGTEDIQSSSWTNVQRPAGTGSAGRLVRASKS